MRVASCYLAEAAMRRGWVDAYCTADPKPAMGEREESDTSREEFGEPTAVALGANAGSNPPSLSPQPLG